jgi:hypothetical protein
MGYSIKRLEIIKERFIKSNSRELKNFFRFIEEQLAGSGHLDHESKYAVTLDTVLVKKIKANITKVKLEDLEGMLDFAEERIERKRISDKAEKIMGDMGRDEFYSREERYSDIEIYIFTLKFG